MANADDAATLKCRYASKRCWNPRAIKRNGERHNLCEVHRQKANSNQRRLDKKRKAGQLAIGLHGPLLADQDRRLHLRSSIALKLEKELHAGGFAPQFLRPPPADADASLSPLDAFRSAHSRDLDAARTLNGVASGHWGASSWREPAVWEHEWPKSPRAMLRAAAALKREAAMPELRRAATFGGYSHRQHSHQQEQQPLPPVERSPPRMSTGYLPSLATAVARTSQGMLASARSSTWQPERIHSAPHLMSRLDL